MNSQPDKGILTSMPQVELFGLFAFEERPDPLIRMRGQMCCHFAEGI
jgi:hypothetical protein